MEIIPSESEIGKGQEQTVSLGDASEQLHSLFLSSRERDRIDALEIPTDFSSGKKCFLGTGQIAKDLRFVCAFVQ